MLGLSFPQFWYFILPIEIMANPIHGICLQNPLFSCFSSCSCRRNSSSPKLKNSNFKNMLFFGQNYSVAKMLCFGVLSASLPCAVVSEMHALKKARGAHNTAWGSDFVSSHHDFAKKIEES